METTLNTASMQRTLTARVMAYPLVRIILGMVLTFIPVPLVMLMATRLADKPHRMVWPQLVAAVLVWFCYRFYVRRLEKRQPTELATSGMARQLGTGLMLGAALVLLTFAMLAALGAYQFGGINPFRLMLLVPLAEMILVGLTEELIFRGVLFGVTERALGSKAAIVISSLVFGLAHLPNQGISVLAVAVIVTVGVMQAAIYMATRRLWLCIGFHIAWNYCVGQVFSSSVSGHAVSDGLLRGELAGNSWLTGGAFGVEGSLIALLLIGVATVFWLSRAFGWRK